MEQLQKELENRSSNSFKDIISRLFDLHPERDIIILEEFFKEPEYPYRSWHAAASEVGGRFGEIDIDNIVNYCFDEETEALIYKLEKYCNNNYIDMYAGQSLVYYVTRQEPYKIYHTTF